MNHNTIDNYCCACEFDIARFENHINEIRKNYELRLLSCRSQILDEVERLIIDEINIARFENEKTSRLTGLAIKVKKLK